jgi:hypothetical protein
MISYLLTFLKLQKSKKKQSRCTCLRGLFTPSSGTNTNCLRLVFLALHLSSKTLACQLMRFGADVYFRLINHIIVFTLKCSLMPFPWHHDFCECQTLADSVKKEKVVRRVVKRS